jgi:glycosyltransferase involved in cell wall biosynthesis
MKKRILILVAKYIDKSGSIEIGGIETYITQLIHALSSSYQILVFQPATQYKEYLFEDVKVVCVESKTAGDVINYIEKNIIGGDDLLIISTEQLSVSTSWKRTVVIQHGIYWDLPVHLYTSSKIARNFALLYKWIDNIRNFKRIKSFKNIVCVDYCYPLWLRSFINLKDKDKKIWVIPNHAGDKFFIEEKISVNNGVKILFSRRFMKFRGTREFARAAERLLRVHNNLTITISGDGPDGGKMQEILPPSERVKYVKTAYVDMPALVAENDIVVVPSLGSEGTSLSAIEAMAAGKTVVASSVGGLTNIIIDQHNGFLVPPGDEDRLYEVLNNLILSSDVRLKVGRVAKNIAVDAFSFAVWSKKWNLVLNQFMKENI